MFAKLKLKIYNLSYKIIIPIKLIWLYLALSSLYILEIFNPLFYYSKLLFKFLLL